MLIQFYYIVLPRLKCIEAKFKLHNCQYFIDCVVPDTNTVHWLLSRLKGYDL